jgi:hypothetical protein
VPVNKTWFHNYSMQWICLKIFSIGGRSIHIRPHKSRLTVFLLAADWWTLLMRWVLYGSGEEARPHQTRRGSERESGGGVEYLHCSPESYRRRRKGKSRIWDSKIWSRVPRDSDPRMTALARVRSNCDWQTLLSSERAPHINKPSIVW